MDLAALRMGVPVGQAVSPKDRAHDIAQYLSDERVAGAVARIDEG